MNDKEVTRSCTDCLFAHFIDDDYGYCDWYRFGKAPVAIKKTLNITNVMINRKDPFFDCPAWNAIKPVVSFEVD